MMPIWQALILFLAGLVLIIKGGDWFVDSASWIAQAVGIPSFIVGATIVSFATTMPEMLVSAIAAVGGKNDMAIGNAVGSVTANTALIMALSMVFMGISARRAKYIRQCTLLIAGCITLWLGCITGTLQLWCSLVLMALFVMFMTINVQEARREVGSGERAAVNSKDMGKNILFFLVGAVCIVIGSQLLVNGGSAIAEFLGVPERVIAVTLVAVGTSLPELVTTITAIRKRESQLSIGNIIGANFIDIALILPVCSFVSRENFSVSQTAIWLDFPVCLAVTLIALIPILIRQKASKIQGFLLLAIYAGYIAVTVQ